jgi:enoyl-CoA hydratase/carnithine racemase
MLAFDAPTSRIDARLASHPSDEVLTRFDGHVLVVTFHRPDRMNASTPQLIGRYMEILLAAAAEPAVRAIVVTGAGKAFCAGADAAYLEHLADGQTRPKKLRRHWFTTRVPKPVIAAINGACVGVGLVMAMMCDVRIAARSARLGAVFPRLGLPAENGLAWTLVRSLGYSKAFEFAAIGRLVAGDPLLRLGVVNELVDDDAVLPRALELAHDMADGCSPRAMASIKRQLLEALHTTLPEADVLSEWLIQDALQAPDFKEAMAARKGRRPPAFEPLPPEPTWWPLGDPAA